MNNKELAELYKPHIYLHSSELIAPTSLESYMKNSRLCIKGTGNYERVKSPYISDTERVSTLLNPTILKTEESLIPPYSKMDIDILKRNDTILQYMKSPFKDPHLCRLNCVPIYADIQKNETDGYIDIVYYFIFTYNGAYKLFNKLYISGEHHYDCENIRIRLTMDYKINTIFYSAHSPDQGSWVSGSDLTIDNDTHPVVYLARGSHATYNKPGIKFRLCCFANDMTNSGLLWIPDTVIELNEDNINTQFMGDMGIDGGINISHKIRNDNRNTPDPPYKATFIYRCFILPYRQLIKRTCK